MNNFPRKPNNPEGEPLLPGQEIPDESRDLSRAPESQESAVDAGIPATMVAGQETVEASAPRIEHVLQDIDPITGHPKYQELQASLDEEIKRGGPKAGVNLLIRLASEGVNPAMVESLRQKIKE